MTRTVKAQQLKYLIPGAGGLGLALRIILYATGIDGRGLLKTGHWANIALWILTLLTAAGLIFLCRRISGPENYTDALPVSAPAVLGNALGSFAILATAVSEFSLSSRMDLIASLLGAGAGLSLLALAVFRLTGRKPSPLFHALVSLFFALRMIQQYRLWSADPQLQDYCFRLSAYVSLMLSAYHHAEFEAGMGDHKRLWLFSLAAVYFCTLSLKGAVDTMMMLCCGIWAFTNLTSLTVHPRRQRPMPNLDEAPGQER